MFCLVAEQARKQMLAPCWLLPSNKLAPLPTKEKTLVFNGESVSIETW